MKKSRFIEQQIAYALRQAESGVPIEESTRKMGIGALVIFSWIWHKKGDAGRGLFTLTIAGSILFLFSGTIMKAAFGICIADDAHITGFVFELLVALILWQKNLMPLSPFINTQQNNPVDGNRHN